MPHDSNSNVFYFKGMKDLALPAGEEKDRIEEMQAIAACLEYLYGEAMRMEVHMSAHLIGAAAESLREKVRQVNERLENNEEVEERV